MTSISAELCERLLRAEGQERLALLEQVQEDAEALPYLLGRVTQIVTTSPLEALQIAQVAEEVAVRRGDGHALAQVTRTMAQAHRIMGNHEAALRAFDVATQQAFQLGDSLLASQIQIGRVDSLGWLGRFDEAVSCADNLIKTLRAAGAEEDIAKVLVNLGNIYYRRDHFADSLRCYEEASEALARSGNRAGKARADFNRANILTEQYRVEEAFDLLGELRAFFLESGMATAIAMTDSNVGILHQRSGQYAAALTAHEQARREFVRFQQELQTAQCDADMADAYRLLNLRTEALEAYERAIEVFRAHSLNYERGRAELGRAAILASLGNKIAAGEAIQEAETIFKRRNNPVHWAHTRLLRACWLLDSGDLDAAAQTAQDATRVYRRHRLYPQAAEALFVQADVAFRKGENATSKMEAVRRLARKYALGWLECRAEEALGRYYANNDRYALALKHFRSAVEALEAARTLVVGEDFHTAFLQDKLSIYEEIVAFLLTPAADDPALALEYVERSKSRLLLEKVQAAINGIDTGGVERARSGSISQPDQDLDLAEKDQTEKDQTEKDQTEKDQTETAGKNSTQAKLAELRAQLNRLYNQMQPRYDERSSRLVSNPANSMEALFTAEDAYRVALRTAELEADTGISTLSQVATTDQLQAWTAPGETLVEYYIVHGEICAFLLTNDHIKVCRSMGTPAEIEQLARRVRYHLHRANSARTYVEDHMDQLLVGIQKPLARLYDLLLRPLSLLLSTERITIVPHGILHGLPFHAFFDRETGQYALDRWEVTYAPSATLRYAGRSRRVTSDAVPERNGNQTALIMGVPDVGLENVAEEVKEVAKTLPDSQLFYGDNATVEAFYANACDKRLIHLATHALFRADTPLFSGLRFANGWLLARDLYGLRLKSELVILSACRTGQALVESGDEMFGLLRGFLAAGARSVAVSLWPADDRATSILMRRFHPLLRQGMPCPAALRWAQQEVRQQYPHPYQWAAFALFGER